MATIPPNAPPWSSLVGKLHDGLLRGLASMGYERMTPVQQKVICEMPSLRSDCLVQAKTGTGKTIAFLLPALQALLTQSALPPGQVAILVLSPTRELALQIAKECDSITVHLKPKIECHTAYGGTSKARDLNKFCNGNPKVVVATPGRLNDYLSDDYIAEKFANLRTLVLDEADQMLDAGFLPEINKILQRLPAKQQGWQGMCFSATLPAKMESVLSKVLNTGFTRLSTIDPDETPTIDRVTQHSIVVASPSEVYGVLLTLLMTERNLQPHSFKAIVFGATANGVALLYSLFYNLFPDNSKVFQLQSRLTQTARTRTTNEFKEASEGIMFASDVIGRGMDFPNVNLVVQIGLPSSRDQYVHRVGRTARAGNEGRAVIILSQREKFFLSVNKHLPITPYPESLTDSAAASSHQIEHAFAQVDAETKRKAYQAWLGFHKTFTKQLQLSNEGLVREANDFAASMGCPEPPPIEKKTIGKMGLKGVRGLNIGASLENSSGLPPRGRVGKLLHSATPQPNVEGGPKRDGNSGAGDRRRGRGGRQGGASSGNKRGKGGPAT